MKINELVKILPEVISIDGPLNMEINSVVDDSRQVKEGALFVAVTGDNFDGHDFIPEVIKRGANAVIGEKPVSLAKDKTYIRVNDSRKALAISSAWFYGFPGDKLRLIGVTGTSGKTTTTYLIRAMLEEVGATSGVIGTIRNIIKDRELPTSFTTPGSLKLNELFSQMVEQNVEYVVMEVSSHSLKLHRVEGLTFEVGVFTNLTQDHLDFHKTLEDYFWSKQKLFKQSKQAVINIDDKSGTRLLDIIDIPATTYGIENPAHLMAQNIRQTMEGVYYDLVYQDEKYPVFYGVPGRFSVYNSLSALAVGITLGFPIDSLINALKKVKGVPGRFEPVENDKGFTVLVDYAHKPDSLKNVLLTIKEFCKGNIITVFGCGGDRDREKRPIMGKIATELSDYTIITSDNPRSEDPEAIIRQIESGVVGRNYQKITDRRKAIQQALLMAKKGDTVLIAGKGHETYQIIGDKKLHFDDKEVVKEFLSGGGL
ncbi:MAG TPA: UDP-N-acetylmuramoyl-L-alanyl-D-glutamate--2,6-diaminopimelate ligase [Thermoanaerobacterales bacterium]|uniref:UDP-N-acetylmuramoyl-L-alanyl-D-glutamate--2, 6-diaminopimelate ligase n=1 Tax=Tepidanaerobacter sp. GT38 TaxID=2722793 RepID=UPI0017CAE23D|nr:UDP-N-acetylmuramoyl-L-alanyl-D-glutamate--2,6-diaminopimelate ligase [Tepidanaerobacter sp. GT38]MCG1012162.1 UDP-N-acetylmuramoyl-L-alanyl-D-glutamate--2,6-diaminopimelate ligase [Tepidanaerobacter sp. GT38]HHY42378.1 UDP-N-acetylmuramoyl-L-alanyl-D-glutamate--2,6-diaminopimelate ligase [Thermoanaerobacterales bacterium]